MKAFKTKTIPSTFCFICSGPFTQGSNDLPTPCGHIFHKFCLAMQVKGKQSCPQCCKILSIQDLKNLGIELTIPARQQLPKNIGESKTPAEEEALLNGRPRRESTKRSFRNGNELRGKLFDNNLKLYLLN